VRRGHRGLAWHRRWELLSHDGCRAEMRYRQPAEPGWSFAFEARQRIALSPTALHVALSLRNLDTQPQAGGLGWHAYFQRRPRSRLAFGGGPADAFDAPLDGLEVDCCFAGRPGTAKIADAELSLRLSSSLNRLGMSEHGRTADEVNTARPNLRW
jgi:aldose 1-epimerase